MLGIFLDTETNGLNPFKHKVLELAFKILDMETGDVREHFQATVRQPRNEWDKSDTESLRVNGFTWEEIEKGISCEELAEQIQRVFAKFDIVRGKAVFICQNPSFDRAFFNQIFSADLQEALRWPYHWLDLASMYWAEAIRLGKEDAQLFPWVSGYSKDKIAAAYCLAPEAQPHRAMNGVDHLLLCYTAVVGFPMINGIKK